MALAPILIWIICLWNKCIPLNISPLIQQSMPILLCQLQMCKKNWDLEILDPLQYMGPFLSFVTPNPWQLSSSPQLRLKPWFQSFGLYPPLCYILGDTKRFLLNQNSFLPVLFKIHIGGIVGIWFDERTSVTVEWYFQLAMPWQKYKTNKFCCCWRNGTWKRMRLVCRS